MITYRFLEKDDPAWETLRSMPFGQNGLPPPEHCLVLVAEEAGQIVALWSAMTAVHLEGLWIDPSHRRSTIAGRLLMLMREKLVTLGLVHSFTIVQTQDVKDLALKAGFVEMDGELLHWDLSKEDH